MDLAEIRKKAKARPKSQEPSVVAETRPGSRLSPSIQGNPPESEKLRMAPCASSTDALPTEMFGDRLDALFSFRSDIALATEEGYLQTLRARDEAEQQVVCEWLTFSLGTEEYALDINGITEIIKLREITDVPRVPDFILGIISLRGIIIPVFDLKRRLKLGVGEMTPSSRIIVCQRNERMAGLLVDSISQVVRVPAGSIEPPPSILSGLDRELLEGVGRIQGRMLILLELGNVLNAELI